MRIKHVSAGHSRRAWWQCGSAEANDWIAIVGPVVALLCVVLWCVSQ